MTAQRIKYAMLSAIATGLAWALALHLEPWSRQGWLLWLIAAVVMQPMINFVRDTWPWRKSEINPYQLVATGEPIDSAQVDHG